jgi:hypothetical protein
MHVIAIVYSAIIPSFGLPDNGRYGRKECSKVTKFKLGRVFEVAITKPTVLEIAALALVLLFVGLFLWR